MNMKRKLINVAVLGALGLSGSAGAAVTTSSLGQVLLFPYYSVRSGNNTLVSITNTTGKAKAVKVRIIEGKNSREVLDFNLYLSPNDMWTAALTATAEGGKLETIDTSCTVPAIAANQGGPGSVEFRNFAYSGSANADGESVSLDRTREGYIEVIEMGEIDPALSIPKGSGTGTILVETAVTHVSGTPADCAAIRNAWATGGAFTTTTAYITPPGGGIYGNAALINVDQGFDYGFDPTTLASWSDRAWHTEPGSLLPTLGNVSPKQSASFYSGQVVQSNWTGQIAVDPVSALLMRTSVINDFVTDASIKAGTDWVVTFPTKNGYVRTDLDSDADSVDINYDRPFSNDFKLGGACEAVSLKRVGREEQVTQSQTDFSPRPPSGSAELCWETNVVTFNSTNVLGSGLVSINASTSAVGADGWMNLSFPISVVPDSNLTDSVGEPVRQMTDNAGQTYLGLPVIGFSAQKYVNGDVGGVLSNYGGTNTHKFQRNISNIQN
jgi:hypothetical protein